MPALQTTYTTTIRPGIPGMPATTHGYNADTRVVETAAGIGFGLAVSQGTADKGVVLGGAAAVGVSMRDITLVHSAAADLDKYVDNENMSVMVQGDIWVLTDSAVTKGGVCTYDNVTGVLGSTAVGGSKVAFPGRWQTSTSGAGLAKLRVNLP